MSDPLTGITGNRGTAGKERDLQLTDIDLDHPEINLQGEDHALLKGSLTLLGNGPALLKGSEIDRGTRTGARTGTEIETREERGVIERSKKENLEGVFPLWLRTCLVVSYQFVIILSYY